MSFGFYGTRHEIVDLCNPMIAMLDGRADKIAAGGEPGDARRYELDENTVLVMAAKRRVIGALHSICKLRDDYRLRLVMAYFKLGQERGGPPVLRHVAEREGACAPPRASARAFEAARRG